MEPVGIARSAADQSPRPVQQAIECCDETLAPSESFVVDKSGKSPVDELTGMPLPIAPTEDLTSLSSNQINEHHHFFPRLSPALRNSLGGRALRVSRIQRVASTQHNFGENPYHKFFQEGPHIPTDAATQLGMCVLACAGYIPPQTVDTSSGEPIVRSLKEWEYHRLVRPSKFLEPQPFQVKRFRDRRFPGMPLFDAKLELINSRKRQADLTYQNLLYGFDPMKQFMLNRVISQDYSDVRPAIIRDFLERDDAEAGLCLMAIGAYKAAEEAKINGTSLMAVYADIYTDGRLHPAMPESPATIIKHKLGHISHKLEVLPFLKSELSRQRDQRVA
jgi:hypothetical protein